MKGKGAEHPPWRGRPSTAPLQACWTLAAGVALAVLGGCAARPGEAPVRSEPASTPAAAPLPARHWYPAHHEVLTAWLKGLTASSPAATARVAVFDWDNTSVFGDVEETLFQYQLDRLAIRLTPADLARLLPEEVAGVSSLEGGVRLADIRADLLAAYDALWPLIEQEERALARRLPAHRDFRAKAGWLYESLAATPGIGERYAYAWVAFWLGRMTPSEVEQAAAAAFREAVRGPVERHRWKSDTAGRAGLLEYAFTRGLRAQPEMRDLMKAFQQAGVDVYVVSASPEPVVETAARVLDYSLDREHVFGVRLATREEVLLPELDGSQRYPFTYRQGKVDVIREHLPAPPVFVAGDSDTDFEMLTAFDSLELRLVINRNKKGDIRTLYEDTAAPGGALPGTLLQGRDENAGRLHPFRETIPLGQTAATPLR